MKSRENKNSELIYYLIFYALCFVFYLLWAIKMPYNQAPDEYMRMDIPRFIMNNGALPYGWEESIRNEIWGFSYGFNPSLASIIAAGFMKIGSFFLSDDNLFIAARMVSVLSSLGTIIICKPIGDRFFSPNGTKIFVASIALLPQFAFISAYVNNEAFGFFAIALVIFSMLIGREYFWNIPTCILLGFALSLCALSYYNCFGIIPCAFIYCVVSVIMDDIPIDNRLIFFIKRALFVALIIIVLAGWAYARNYVYYDGDWLGLKTRYYYGELYALPEYRPSVWPTPHNQGETYFYMFFSRKWILNSLISAVGVFGYLNVFMFRPVYYLYFLIVLVGILFNFTHSNYFYFDEIRKKKDNIFWLLMILMCAITFFLAAYYSFNTDYQPQGRYLMPMLISFNLIYVSGYNKLVNKLTTEKKAAILTYGMVAFYAIIAFYAFYFVEIPSFNM